MRTFTDLRQTTEVKWFLPSDKGSLYFTPSLPVSQGLLVRHFDRDLEPILTSDFASLINAIADTVQGNAKLSDLITVNRPTEIGVDFVSRPFCVYYYSLADYDSGESDDEEAIDALQKMRSMIGPELSSLDSESKLVAEALRRSLIAPTAKTILDDDDRFLIIEPSMTIEMVRRWVSSYSGSENR